MNTMLTNELKEVLNELKRRKPLILNLTNHVTMDLVANVLLAIGAAPLMTCCDEELEELIQLSSCVNINIGTLDLNFIKRCHLTVKLAKKHKKPIVLDPVGAGASQIRTKTAIALMPFAAIVKGNASEIRALGKTNEKTLGVESMHSTDDAKEIANALSRKYGFTVVVSGPIDFITNGKDQFEVPYGSMLMPKITGMGCALAATLASLRAILDNSFKSAKLGTLYFGLSGSQAEKKAEHPASFRVAFIDALHGAHL